MTKFLITGGLGFLGQHIAKTLLNNFQDSEILLLARSNKGIFLEELNDTRVKIINDLNIEDKESLTKYFNGCDYVIHAAAMISFWKKDKERMNNINVTGTRNVVDLCLKHEIKRLIQVSSTAAICGGNNPNTASDETKGYDWQRKSHYHYGLSKYFAEIEIERGLSRGLDAVIANPCTILGYGDRKIFPLIETTLKKVPFCFSGGSHMVDVRDLAGGIVSLITEGSAGERFLFVGEYHTQLRILTELAGILKVKPPAYVISSKLLLLTIPFLALNDLLSQHTPRLTKTMIINGLTPSYFSYLKSQQILGWKPQYSLEESLAEAVKYYNKEVVK